MDYAIRPGTEKDVPQMLRLWREMMDFHARWEPRFRPLPSPVGERAWERHLNAEDVWTSEDWCVFVAETDGRLVGHIMGVMRDAIPVLEPERYGYVTDMVVDPAARRSGVGQALFDALKAWFRGRDVYHLQLMAAHNNPAAQAFWRTMGCTDYMHLLCWDLEEK